MTTVLTPDLVQLGTRVLTDAEHGDREYFDDLSTNEKTMALAVAEQIGKTGRTDLLYKTLWELDYKNGIKPVSPEEFISSEYYLGKDAAKVYAPWKRDFIHVMNPENQIVEWICSGGIGVGKTTAAQIAQVYKLYYLSCLKDPLQFFGLMESTFIVFLLFSLSMVKAEQSVYRSMQRMLENSPYFRTEYRHRRKRGRIVALGGNRTFEEERELVFPDNIVVTMGSKFEHGLSLNVYSGILDEVNFRGHKTIQEEEDVNSAINLYEAVATRIQSRFMSRTLAPGILCTVSSKRSTADFIDRHIEKVRNNPTVFISDYRMWDVKPETQYSGKRFFIKTGASIASSSFVDDKSDEGKLYQQLFKKGSIEAKKLSDHLLPKNIHSVPVEYRPRYESDLARSLQDISGLSTAPMRLFFDDPTVLSRGIDRARTSPFSVDTVEIGVKSGGHIYNFFDINKVTIFDGLSRSPKFYPRFTRFVHVDLAKGRGDSVGIAMICIPHQINVDTIDVDGKQLRIIRPQIFVDFAIRIRAPQGDEVFFEEIRTFFIWLRNTCNYKLAVVSYDKYESTESFQLLTKNGFKTRYVSVDRTPVAYNHLREAIVENRFSCYDYPPLFDELKNLTWNEETQTVDHPMFAGSNRGSKDVSDAVAGAVKDGIDAVTDKKLPGHQIGQGFPMAPREQPGAVPLAVGPSPTFAVDGSRNPMSPAVTGVQGNPKSRF